MYNKKIWVVSFSVLFILAAFSVVWAVPNFNTGLQIPTGNKVKFVDVNEITQLGALDELNYTGKSFLATTSDQALISSVASVADDSSTLDGYGPFELPYYALGSTASTASAFAANPSNCASGYVAGGIAADGSAENCVLVATTSSQWITSLSNIYYNTGNVGIGTTSPAYKLSVVGDINLTGALRVNGDPFSSGQWTTSGSDIYYNTGKVGLGSATPNSLLHLYQASGNNAELDIQSVSGANNHWGIYQERSDGSLRFWNNNISGEKNALTILSNGNVGIGTVAPDAKFAVVGQNTNNYFSVLGGDSSSYYNTVFSQLKDNSGDFGSVQFYFNPEEGVVFSTRSEDQNSDSFLQIQGSGSGLGYYQNGNPAFLINSNGNIGVGTYNPIQKLDVVGKISLNDGAGSVFIGRNAGFNQDSQIGMNIGIGYEALNTGVKGSGGVAIGAYSQKNANNQTTAWTNTNVSVGYESLKGSANPANNTGLYNSVLGYQAMFSNTSGNYNSANGYTALYSNTEGYGNTANGSQSLYYNTTGSANTANGYVSLYRNTTGSNNTATGVSTLTANTTGNNNTANGSMSMLSNTTGYKNTSNGAESLRFNVSGYENTANGYVSLYRNTTGYRNTSNGTESLYTNTTGNSNTANGYQSLYSNTTGNKNTANGYQSLYSNTTGYDNATNGYQSLYSNTTGYENTTNGFKALYSNISGSDNVAIGAYSLNANQGGSSNVAVGVSALLVNTAGYNNVAIGRESLYRNTLGSSNVAIGRGSLYSNTTGQQNTANGNGSLYSNTIGNYNSAQGYNSLYSNNAGSNGTAIGTNSQYNAKSTTTAWTNTNVSVGYESLKGSATPANNTGLGNAVLGYQSLYSNTSGSENVAIGISSLYTNSTGGYNTSVGTRAMENNTTGAYNVAIGFEASRNITTGNQNATLGYESLKLNTTGIQNAALGYNALNSIVGDYNSGFGSQALMAVTSGSSNTALGMQAGKFIADGLTSNITVNNSLFLGANTKASANNQANEIVIGYNAIGLGSNSVVLGNSNIVTTALRGNVGIGTTTPGYKLTVDGTGLFTGALGIASPIAGGDAATKDYVDAAVGSVASVGPVYLGTTTVSYTGNLGGLSGARTKCAADYGEGARMCTNSDAEYGILPTAVGGGAWIYPSLSNYDSSHYYLSFAMGTSFSVRYGESTNGYGVCSRYTSDIATKQGSNFQGSSLFTLVTCDTSRPILCCR